MFDRYFAPLILVDRMGDVVGKTRLQKLMCILETKLKKKVKLDYDYELHLHGPFSRRLSRLINHLIDQGLVEEKRRTTPSGNPLYAYRLTSEGSRLIKSLRKKGMWSSTLSKAIDEVKEEYGYLPLHSLIDEAYHAFENQR